MYNNKTCGKMLNLHNNTYQNIFFIITSELGKTPHVCDCERLFSNLFNFLLNLRRFVLLRERFKAALPGVCFFPEIE